MKTKTMITLKTTSQKPKLRQAKYRVCDIMLVDDFNEDKAGFKGN